MRNVCVILHNYIVGKLLHNNGDNSFSDTDCINNVYKKDIPSLKGV